MASSLEKAQAQGRLDSEALAESRLAVARQQEELSKGAAAEEARAVAAEAALRKACGELEDARCARGHAAGWLRAWWGQGLRGRSAVCEPLILLLPNSSSAQAAAAWASPRPCSA
jgi:hypothetical protein